MSWLASFSRTNSSCAPLMLITGTQPLYAAPMPVTRFVTPGPSVAVTTAGRCKVRAKPYAMKAAPCSWRVRTKRISGVARSTSRIGRFIVPGMPNTWSMPSRLRQSTIACAPVIMKSPIRGSLSGKLGQQEVGLAPPAAVYRMRAAEARGWPVPRVVVQEPARAPLRPGLARPLEVLALERERDAVARRQRRAARPDLDVDLDDLARLELLRLVVRVPGLVRARALRIELPLRRAQPALRHRGPRLDRREERHLLAVRIEGAQRREEVHVVRARRHEELHFDRPGEHERTPEWRTAEGEALAVCRVTRAGRLLRGCGEQRHVRRVEVQLCPSRFREGPLCIANHARHRVVRRAHRDLDPRLVLPAVVDPLQVAVEEFPLQRDVLRQQEGEEIGARLDLEPLVARSDAEISEHRPAQVQPEPAPVGDDERGDLYAAQVRAALRVPGTVQRAREEIADVVLAVGGELLGRQARGPGVALTGGEVDERRVGVAVLVAQNAAVPPAVQETRAEDPALTRAVAVEVVGALP